MATLKSLRAQIQKLQNEEQRLVREAMAGSIAKVKRLMQTLGVTVEHLGDSASSKAAKGRAAKSTVADKRAARPAKYRDPESGATWSGFGRAPNWIAQSADRTQFLVDAPETSRAKARTPSAKKAPKATKRTASRKSDATSASAASPVRTSRKPASKKKTSPVKAAVKQTGKRSSQKRPSRASKRSVEAPTAPDQDRGGAAEE